MSNRLLRILLLVVGNATIVPTSALASAPTWQG